MENLDKSGLKYFWNKVKNYISARDARTVQPVGSSMVWYGPESTIPSDYMREDGRQLKVADYPELFAVIGYTYGGEGDYFNLPDSRGRTVVHLEDSDEFGTLGAKVGWKVHTLTTAQLPSHGHSFAGTAHNHSFTGSEHTHTFTGTAHKHTFTGTAHNHGFTGSSHYHSYSRSSTVTGSTALTIDQIPSHTHGIRNFNSWGAQDSGYGYQFTPDSSGLMGNNPTDSTGGSKGHTHSISLSSVNTGSATQGGTVGNATATGTIADATAGGTVGKSTQGGTVGNATQGGTVGNTGGGEAFNIIQPSIVGIRIIRVKSDAYTKDIRNLDDAIDAANAKIATLESSLATLQNTVTNLQASTKRKVANAYLEQVDMSGSAWSRPKIPISSGNFKTTDDTVFSCSSNRINVKADGWYRIDVAYHTNIGTGEADTYIEYGGGYETVPGYSPVNTASIVRYLYAGGVSFDINTASTSWRLYHASITIEKLS